MMSAIGDFSVLLSVYKNDDPRHLDIALKSIYQLQTLKPRQIVIVADGKLPFALISVIQNFEKECDSSLTFNFVQIENNVGLAVSLNEGMKYCLYEIVARMDSDDISLPERFEKQYDFMRRNSDVAVCGTMIDEIDKVTEVYLATRKVPLHQNDIIKFAKKRSPVSHPSVMFRKEKIIEVGGYPLFRKSQDYALWSLLLVKGAMFANLNEVLLKMRTGNDFMARRGLSHFRNEFHVVMFQYKIGFLSWSNLVASLSIRLIFRAMPNDVKKILYKLVRKF